MTNLSTKRAYGQAHSKVILVGEHAVVYGQPAIAMPFPLKVTATTEEDHGPIVFDSTMYSGPIDSMPLKMKGMADCIKGTLCYLKQPFEGLRIQVHSSIPLGRGLGSSAAVAIAIVRSLFSFYGQKPSQKALFSLVQIAEVHAHGNPSGIDMAAAASDWPIWFEKGKEMVPIEYGGPFHLILADTGRIGDTRKAVANVRENYMKTPVKIEKALKMIEKITVSTKIALLQGTKHRLGDLLNHNHEALKILGVSDQGIDDLVQAAREAGALGAKITGGGLGGCIIALARSLEDAQMIAEALLKAGATKSWYFSTHDDNLYPG